MLKGMFADIFSSLSNSDLSSVFDLLGYLPGLLPAGIGA